MLPTKRIQKNYNTYLSILQFVLKNNKNPEFKDFNLVQTYNDLLGEIKKNLDKFFGYNVYIEYQIEKSRKQKYNKEELELIKRFQMVQHLTDCASDREYDEKETGPSERFTVILKEFNKIEEYFRPILPFLK